MTEQEKSDALRIFKVTVVALLILSFLLMFCVGVNAYKKGKKQEEEVKQFNELLSSQTETVF